MRDLQRPDYVLVVGSGRSGSTWLLDLLDQSPETFCRNEPYGAAGSSLANLTSHRFFISQWTDEQQQQWDEAIQRATSHMGERDRPIQVQKEYISGVSRAIGLCRAVQVRRLRRVLQILSPSLRQGEWSLPWWLGSQQRLAESLSVLKLIASPGWTDFILRTRPNVKVFHIVRHPGGVLNSWLNRYVAHRDVREVKKNSRARLEQLGQCNPNWARRLVDIQRMSIDELELWYWRYMNEVIWESGQQADNYHQLLYEELVVDTVVLMRQVFERCSLSWTESTGRRIAALSSNSVSIATKWRNSLTAPQVDLVERILEDSAMKDWWSNQRSTESCNGISVGTTAKCSSRNRNDGDPELK